MSSLPPALQPWAEALALFAEDLARYLGLFVARLSAAVGALRPRGEAEGGEPQGHDGLTRRGSFERLLVSEWLWALVHRSLLFVSRVVSKSNDFVGTKLHVVGPEGVREESLDALDGEAFSVHPSSGLLAVGEEGQSLWWLSSSVRHKLAQTSGKVAHAEASASRSVLGWLTEAGALVLFDLREGRVLYRKAAEGSA